MKNRTAGLENLYAVDIVVPVFDGLRVLGLANEC